MIKKSGLVELYYVEVHGSRGSVFNEKFFSKEWLTDPGPGPMQTIIWTYTS